MATSDVSELVPSPGDRVLLALSGRADSVLAGSVLRSQDFDIVGLHLRFGRRGSAEFNSRCRAQGGEEGAEQAAKKLQVPFHVDDLTDEFEAKVVDGFVHDFLRQRLPNPCIVCHSSVQMSALFRGAAKLGCQWVATGHGARVLSVPGTERVRLLASVDLATDQSYLLYSIAQERLRRLLFPLGGFSRSLLDRMARELEVTVADSARCQSVCLSEDPTIGSFLESRIPDSLRLKGVIRTSSGLVVGEHQGLHRHYLGQKGLKLAVVEQEQRPWCVVGFDAPRQVLIVGPEGEFPSPGFACEGARWVRPIDGLRGMRCVVRFSPIHAGSRCRVTVFENDSLHVELERPESGPVPGQGAVFYDGEEVIGGAIIDRIESLEASQGGRDLAVAR